MDIVRVLRVLEYVGSREWVEECIQQRYVKGERYTIRKGVIREAILGETLEIVDRLDVPTESEEGEIQ